jgi:ribosomal protein L15
VTTMHIKTETVTYHIGKNGEKCTSRDAAIATFRVEDIAEFLKEHGGAHYDFSVEDAAEAILKNEAVFLKLLGVSV